MQRHILYELKQLRGSWRFAVPHVESVFEPLLIRWSKLSLRVMRFDQRTQLASRHHLFHLFQRSRPPRILGVRSKPVIIASVVCFMLA